MDLLEKYKQLNNSFTKKKLIFHVGQYCGFFSEYRYMIWAMLYCLEHKIRFVLYSKDANFGYDKGWTDYFLPFCEEETDDWHSKHNKAAADWKKQFNPKIIKYHLLHRNTYLSSDIWRYYTSNSFQQKQFDIPELGIKGDLWEACHVLVNVTWNYNAAVRHAINRLIAELKLPENYIGFHIRSGDKYVEVKLLPVSDYVEAVCPVSDLRDAFVSTDNYDKIREFNDGFQDWTVFTLCRKEEKGYFHSNFMKQSLDFRKKQFETFFASIEILHSAAVFVGTLSSGPGYFEYIRRPKGTTLSVDS
ncbi:hypothetical protein EZS27_007099 [termite gut metagenome]|uniref:Uncharacterized protein n=1 Tax=termite gut metagenome TaxID=433724 RepID=A0A5J4SJC5_9ZZZZ